MLTTNTTLRLVCTLACLMMGVATVSTASAQSGECFSDDDCGSGFTCERPNTSVPCTIAPGDDEPNCAEPEPDEGPGECVRGPIECNSDSDCPGVLRCVEGPTAGIAEAPCFPDEDGNCADFNEDPVEPPEATSYCEYMPSACEGSGECDEGFDCVFYGGGGFDCAVACEPGGDCDADFACPDVEPAQEDGYCEPQEIECDTDSDCPSEWSCYTQTSEWCSSGGGGGSTGGAPAPGEDERCAGDDCEEKRPVEECGTETISRCLPPGLEDYYGGNGGGNVTSSGGGSDNEGVFDDQSDRGSDDDDDNGRAARGCTVGAVSGSTGAAGGLLGLALLALGAVVVRRR